MLVTYARTLPDVGKHLCLFLAAQPFRLLGTVIQEEERDDAQKACRQSLNDEHPLPAVHCSNTFHVGHQPTRHRSTDQTCDTRCTGEDCDGLCATFHRIPARQIENDAWVETGL